METSRDNENSLRLNIFLLTVLLHLCLLTFLVFPAAKKLNTDTPPAAVIIRLIDVNEEPPPLAPPVYREVPPDFSANTVEAVAENILEVDEVPDQIVVQGIIYPYEIVEARGDAIEYLSMSKVSNLPELPLDQIRRNIVYPRIAQSAGIEGAVYLELFIDSQGNIRDINILSENPANRGFGDAAVNAFNGIKATKPGEADGRPVAVRYRYPVRFALR
jgi:protein TonB